MKLPCVWESRLTKLVCVHCNAEIAYDELDTLFEAKEKLEKARALLAEAIDVKSYLVACEKLCTLLQE